MQLRKQRGAFKDSAAADAPVFRGAVRGFWRPAIQPDTIPGSVSTIPHNGRLPSGFPTTIQ
ncbi:MAG: hypothetical protein KDA85_07665 [Planctomycetaceae bacterium]|nr:hypothetical protein [Planctomycetaceae bacterium]